MQSYGLANIWAQGDLITRGIAIALLAMSILTWTVIAVKGWNLARLGRLTKHAEREFWHSDDFAGGIDKLSEALPAPSDNPFLALALSGQEAADHHQRTRPHLHDRLDVSDWITRCLKDTMDDGVARMQRGLAVLASIGSTAPFVGLFGTVWGIYHALIGIGSSGQVSIDQIAGPIGEALIMTAFGLVVAIPAVLGYNVLTRSNKAIIGRLRRFAHGLHAYFVTGAHLASAASGNLRLATRARANAR
jgi:biopolymer transport protein ExbB